MPASQQHLEQALSDALALEDEGLPLERRSARSAVHGALVTLGVVALVVVYGVTLRWLTAWL